MTLLKKLIRENKISMHQLVEKTGYSFTHLSAVINGKKKITFPMWNLMKLALLSLQCDRVKIMQALEELWALGGNSKPLLPTLYTDK